MTTTLTDQQASDLTWLEQQRAKMTRELKNVIKHGGYNPVRQRERMKSLRRRIWKLDDEIKAVEASLSY